MRFLLSLFAVAFAGVFPAFPYPQKIVQQFRSNDLPASIHEPVPDPRPWRGSESGPVSGLQLFAREKQGAFWLGGKEGAARFDPKAAHPWERWRYFYGRRWLPDNEVINLWLDQPAQPKTWIRTRTGVSVIESKPLTLEDKANFFEERIEKRHVRHGLVANSSLGKPGHLDQNIMRDNDNDGLWTAIYLGAQAYRHAVTGSVDARRKARRALSALMRLEEITGVPGYYARSFVAASEPHSGDGEWHTTRDGQWIWKGDTSSDESVGHYYAYAIYYDLVANPGEKEEISRVVARMTDYLIAHDYELPDLDGEPTRWGRWSEKYFLTEEGRYEAALRSLELLSFLKTTHHITKQAKYQAAYEDRIRRGYARHLTHYRRWPGGGEINFSDDELAYFSYDPLLRYERDLNLRAIYLESLRFTWEQIKPDKNPLWNFISVAAGAGKMSKEILRDSRMTLERIPWDLVDWRVQNSHRQDVQFHQEKDRFSKPQLTRALAPDERPVQKWNSNPYIPDGGGEGVGEDDGAFFLLPYWMGRYHGWIKSRD